jgi:small GTP-binding protein
MAKLNKNEITKMRIIRIEKEIRDTPYHKATEHHIGRLRAKLSKLKEELKSAPAKKGGRGGGYAIKKQGDATVVLVGPPSAGKSTLLNRLTNAKSKVAPYAFTTLSVIPGMMAYRNAKIQILDVPGLIEGAEKGKGRGQEVLSVARGANLLIIITDTKRKNVLENIKLTLHENGIRINEAPPNIVVNKKVSGGISIHSNLNQQLSKETIKEVALEMGIKNAEITLKENPTIERLIDAFSTNRAYIPALFVINKCDLISKSPLVTKKPLNEIYISAKENTGTKKLKRMIWNTLELTRIYLVRRSEKPSKNSPITMRKGQTLKEVAEKIGSEFAEDITRAKIWGAGAKFPGQEVSLSKKILDGMQVRFI